MIVCMAYLPEARAESVHFLHRSMGGRHSTSTSIIFVFYSSPSIVSTHEKEKNCQHLHSESYKQKLLVLAYAATHTNADTARHFDIHPSMVSRWKQQQTRIQQPAIHHSAIKPGGPCMQRSKRMCMLMLHLLGNRASVSR